MKLKMIPIKVYPTPKVTFLDPKKLNFLSLFFKIKKIKTDTTKNIDSKKKQLKNHTNIKHVEYYFNICTYMGIIIIL